MKFVINGFDKLDIESQKQIQDFVSGITPNFIISEEDIYSSSDCGCDVCGLSKHLFRIDTDGGIIHLCKECRDKR